MKTELEAITYIPSYQPLFYLSKLVGIKPLKLERRRNLIILKSGAGDFYYSLFYFTVYTICTSYCIYRLTTADHSVIISQAVFVTEIAVFASLIFITLISSYVFRKMLIKASKFVHEIDLTFKGIKVGVNERSHLKQTKRLMLMAFASISIRTVMMLAAVPGDVIQQSLCFLAALVKTLSKYEFVVMILPISDRFNQINRCINLCPRKNAGCLAETLYLLCRLHYKLCNVSRIINTAFAVQLLISLAVSLTDILFESYFIYANLNGNVTNWAIANAIVWTIDEVLEIYVLVRACAVTCENANNTPIILHELRNHLQNFEIEKHIQMYSLQMLHQKIRFSALGFFMIDYSLIYSMAGAVTTYLVIFIQFDQNQQVATFEGNSTTTIP